MSYVASWSGGKESCFACYEAIREGCAVSHIVNFIAEESDRVRFHGTEAALIRLQAEAVGIDLVQKATAPDDYEPAFKAAVRSVIPLGVEGMIFGDLYVQEHRDWVERVCRELGIEAVEPLWGRDPEGLLLEFVDAGFVATVVSANSEMVGREWVGRKVDREFLAYLKSNDIDPCGEAGEYHTLVTDGPLFERRIEITKSRPVRRNGYWFLDTVEYRIADRSNGTGNSPCEQSRKG